MASKRHQKCPQILRTNEYNPFFSLFCFSLSHLECTRKNVIIRPNTTSITSLYHIILLHRIVSKFCHIKKYQHRSKSHLIHTNTHKHTYTFTLTRSSTRQWLFASLHTSVWCFYNEFYMRICTINARILQIVRVFFFNSNFDSLRFVVDWFRFGTVIERECHCNLSNGRDWWLMSESEWIHTNIGKYWWNLFVPAQLEFHAFAMGTLQCIGIYYNVELHIDELCLLVNW